MVCLKSKFERFHKVMRDSTIIKNSDSAGEYVVEIFDAVKPKSVIVCVHGRGVRRWDGEKFFYAVAEQYPQYTFLLVDQNQFDDDEACELNPLPVATARVQKLLDSAKEKYAGVPIIVMGHSLGCAITTRLDLNGVDKVIFVAPAAGTDSEKLLNRYGADIAKGKRVTSADGVTRYFSAEYFASLQGIIWEDEYRKLLARYQPIHAFESSEEEIVSEDRFAHRHMPFASYQMIPGATHNLHGEPLQWFFDLLDPLLKQ
jgi:pimeloyl-ACP methyl ester carboxylesterase